MLVDFQYITYSIRTMCGSKMWWKFHRPAKQNGPLFHRGMDYFVLPAVGSGIPRPSKAQASWFAPKREVIKLATQLLSADFSKSRSFRVVGCETFLTEINPHFNPTISASPSVSPTSRRKRC